MAPTVARSVLLLLVVVLAVAPQRPCAAASARAPTTVLFRKSALGNIFALDGRADPPTETELEGTAAAARLVAVALSPSRVFWSDHRSIRSARADDGADVRTDVGTLVRVRWTGVHFGESPDDVLELSVQGMRCVSVASWSPTHVECLVALPRVDAAPAEDDCVLVTRRGDMRGAARNRYEELRASGVASPIVEHLVIDTAPVVPLALAVDAVDEALFWANALDGVVYRSSLRDTALDVVQRDAWDVKGLSLLRWPGAAATELLFSLEGKGLVKRTRFTRGTSTEAETVLLGLRSPRGVAVDPLQQFLYFTEKTGRLYRTLLRALRPLPDADDTALPVPAALPEPQLLVTLSTLTRLDGIAVDDAYVYWCETNANVVARASVDSFKREELVGGSADLSLSWPRGIALRSTDGARNAAQGDFYYVEYTGRVAKGKDRRVLVNDLRVSTMKNLDQLIQQHDAPTQFYALE